MAVDISHPISHPSKSVIANAFTHLLFDEHFSDVSLVTEDEKILKAHKIVLSASSPFLKDILFGHQHPDPLIHLEGVRQDELSNLLQIIYSGKCEVKPERLQEFLNAAKELRISSVEDWKVDEHEAGTRMVEEVEDGECLEGETGNNLVQQEKTFRRRSIGTMGRKKINRRIEKLKLFENSPKVRKMQTNRQPSGEIERQKHIGRKGKDVKLHQLSFASKPRGRTRNCEIDERVKEMRMIVKPAFDSQLQEFKCKFCGNIFASKGALSYHMASEQCL